MGKLGSVEIVHRQTDRLVEGFDACAAQLSDSPRYIAECVEKIPFVSPHGAAQQLRCK
jgi:hypothetical protein